MKKIDIMKEKDEFIAAHPIYKADIEYFFSYIQKKSRLEPPDIGRWFCSITSQDVRECLMELCDAETFKTKSKARNFVNALAKFFRQLLFHNLSNQDLREELQSELGISNSGMPYYTKLMEYISDEPRLKDGRDFNPISQEDVETLIKHCNELIDRRISYKKGVEPKIFGQMSSALCVKLILFSGISYSVARMIDANDLNTDSGIIEINNIQLILPPNLSYQFREYWQIYMEKGLNETTTKLFVGKNGEPWGEKTPDSGIVTVLKAAINKSSVSEINRRAIQQHIRNGMPERTIIQLTGEKDDVLIKCYEYVYADSNDMFSLVNSAIVKNPTYSIL